MAVLQSGHPRACRGPLLGHMDSGDKVVWVLDGGGNHVCWGGSKECHFPAAVKAQLKWENGQD